MTRLVGILAVVILAALGLWGARLLTREAPAAAPDFFTWGTPGREHPSTFDRPRCVSVAPDGTLWVLDLTGRIQHFTPAGAYLGEIHMPDVSVGRPQGIDVDRAGNIYVADTHYDQILKFAPDGTILLRFGERGTDPGQLFWPCAIVVADDGIIYTAEYGGVTADGGFHDRIQKWTAEGRLLAHWGRFGEEPGSFMRPAGLALGPDGNLYVADAANHRIQVFSTDGRLLRLWGHQGTAPGELYNPYDIAIDARGCVYVVEYGASRVQCFSPAGAPLAHWGALHRGGIGLFQPWGLDVTAGGTVFVTDTYNHRVVRAPLAVATVGALAQATGTVHE